MLHLSAGTRLKGARYINKIRNGKSQKRNIVSRKTTFEIHKHDNDNRSN